MEFRKLGATWAQKSGVKVCEGSLRKCHTPFWTRACAYMYYWRHQGESVKLCVGFTDRQNWWGVGGGVRGRVITDDILGTAYHYLDVL